MKHWILYNEQEWRELWLFFFSNFGVWVKMARMLTAEKLKLKHDLSRVLRKQLSCSQRTVLQKLGIYCDASKTVNLDFDGFEDSMLWQLRRELRNLVGSNGDGKEDDGKDDDEASKKKKADGPDGKEQDDDDDEASKKKALRAAMLKSRFAETIWKANNGGRFDPDRERERLKRLRREEEELKKIEIREEAELKRRREQQMNEEREAIKRRRQQQINKEREAARMALELVEKNADVEDNWKVMKDFEMLINCCSASACC